VGVAVRPRSEIPVVVAVFLDLVGASNLQQQQSAAATSTATICNSKSNSNTNKLQHGAFAFLGHLMGVAVAFFGATKSSNKNLFIARCFPPFPLRMMMISFVWLVCLLASLLVYFYSPAAVTCNLQHCSCMKINAFQSA